MFYIKVLVYDNLLISQKQMSQIFKYDAKKNVRCRFSLLVVIPTTLIFYKSFMALILLMGKNDVLFEY